MKFSFDREAHEAISSIETSPKGAVDALLIAAEYMKAGEVLPENLAQWLANAFIASMGKPDAKRGKALLRELGLTHGNRRQAGNWCQIGSRFQELLDEGMGQNEAAETIAVDSEYDESIGKISESTAKRYWKIYCKAESECDEIE